ncbi:hypothetical protein ABZ249_16650 [Nocardiopsis sp. NPDC006139]|uniref:hypothetical protein n=1 Tax=Nocardiopsis sp. NPDC006139 TaxID=3154578 RepID=UPI0033A0F341
MSRADVVAVRWAAAAAFGVVLALCVLLALLLWSLNRTTQAGVPSAGLALGTAAMIGLLGGGCLGVAMSWAKWEPAPGRSVLRRESAPARDAYGAAFRPPATAAPSSWKRAAGHIAWVGGAVLGLFSVPVLFLPLFAFWSVLPSPHANTGPAGALLSALLVSGVLGTLFGLGLWSLLDARHAPARPLSPSGSPAVRRRAARAVRQGNPTGDPTTDLVARDIALQMVNERWPAPVFLLSLLGPFLLLLPGSTRAFQEDGFTLHSLAPVGLLVFLVLTGIACTVLVAEHRKQASRFLELFKGNAARDGYRTPFP